MEIAIVQGDLFNAPETDCLVHCISADFALGKGIALEFQKRFHLREQLKEQYPGGPSTVRVGQCIRVGRVFNLVTKSQYWGKPTYATLHSALVHLRQECMAYNIRSLSMPLIGCGLDRLDWSNVERHIREVFQYTNIYITVYIK